MVAMSQLFTVTAERGNGVWVLESDLGAVSQVRRLDQAAGEMREAIAHLAGLPCGEVEVEVVPVLPEAYTAASRRAEELRAQGGFLAGEFLRGEFLQGRGFVAAGDRPPSSPPRRRASTAGRVLRAGAGRAIRSRDML